MPAKIKTSLTSVPSNWPVASICAKKYSRPKGAIEAREKAKAQAQSNLTDADSRLMRKGRNGAYTQSYNAQASVEAEGSQLIVSAHVTQSAADTPELEAGINNIVTELGRPGTLRHPPEAAHPSRQGNPQQSVEPPFGIIQQAMGFRQFLLRGLDKVQNEWQLQKHQPTVSILAQAVLRPKNQIRQAANPNRSPLIEHNRP